MSPALVWMGLLAALVTPPGGTGFSAADERALLGGKVVTHVDTEKTARGMRAHGEAGVVIHRPLRECFELVARYESLSTFLPGLAESHVLERGHNGFRARAATQMLFFRYRYGLRFEVDRAANELRWTLDESQPKDIADTRGSWRFIALDDRTTVLHYSMRVDTGLAVPQSIQNYFTGRSLPDLMVAFRDHLEKEGR